MGRSCWLLALLVVGLVMARWVNGYPAEDFVHNLPGQPPVWFRQYAGYVDVDVKAGRSLFYYFVEANDDADKKPLTLWLNGGPGCSSIGGGAFSELGPFFPRGDGRRLRVNHKSWNRVSNLLFVDSPAGVGFSYSNTTSDYNTGDEKTANDMLRFLLGWFEKFPEFKSRKLYLAGESYAGHYIPQLAVVLLNHNKQSKDFIFRLQGVALGNPLLKVRRDAPSTFEYFWSHGMLSDELGLKFRKECDFSGYVYSSDDNNLTKPCLKALDEAYKCVGNFVDAYDVILDVCYPKIAQQMLRLHKIVTKKSMGVDVCIKEENDFYFNLPKVQKAFHANRTKLPHKWSMCDKDLNYSEIDGDRDITKLLKEIIQTDIRVLVYSGDQDSVISLLGTRRNVREVAESLKFNITSPYTPWFHKQQIGGWTTEYGDMLTFATVRAASHLVPYSQPSRALALFKSFVRGVKLPNKTHADPSSDS